MGRPKKTLQSIIRRPYILISAMAARGSRQADIARRFGIDQKTWRRIREDDLRAGEAFEAGRGELHEELVTKLIESAREGDKACLIFALKALFGYRDNAPITTEVFTNVKIELPAALPRARYVREVEGIRPRAPIRRKVEAEAIRPRAPIRRRLPDAT